jgi:hypothetical protein
MPPRAAFASEGGSLLFRRDAEVCDGLVQELQADDISRRLAFDPVLLPSGWQVGIKVAIPQAINLLQGGLAL